MDAAKRPTPPILPKPCTARIPAPLPPQALGKTQSGRFPSSGAGRAIPFTEEPRCLLFIKEKKKKKEGLAASLQVWDRNSGVAGTDLNQTTLAGSRPSGELAWAPRDPLRLWGQAPPVTAAGRRGRGDGRGAAPRGRRGLPAG